MFLVNGLTGHVIFDIDATRSFVYLALSRNFGDVPGALDYPMEEEIVYGRQVRCLRVYRGYILKLFHEKSLIDLVPIPLRRTKIVMVMDWLS